MRIKFWPNKERRTVLMEVDSGSLHVEFEFADLDDAYAAAVDLRDAIDIVERDWS